MEEDEIDLGALCSIMWDRKKVVGKIILGFTLLALIISQILPKEYTSSVMVQTSKSDLSLGGASAAIAALTGGASANPQAVTYIELMKTRVVLDPIIEEVFSDIEEEKRPTAEKFAKKKLDITNTKGTNLINIDAKGRSPEEAQYIATNLVDNFLKLMTELNQNNQSLTVKFLNERIDVAKKDADSASEALEQYSKKNKIYSPGEQTEAILKRSAAYDTTIGEMLVQQQAADAAFASSSSQLGEEIANTEKYNMADNEVIMGIRQSIVSKEINLVNLRQKLTDAHPDVINAQKELEAIYASLDGMVADVIASGSTINPLATEATVAKYQAATRKAVAEASLKKVKELREKSDAEMETLADGVLEYVKLEREARIKQEVYTNLVQQVEASKIKQTMESMDIQIVDPPNLPDIKKPSGPRWVLMTAIGFVLGFMVSFGYGLMIYKRNGIRDVY